MKVVNVVVAIICHVESGHLTLLEHESAVWLAPSELETLRWLPADADVIKRLKGSPLLLRDLCELF